MGFTHTHLSGTGIGDLNDILIMPTVGKLDVTKASKEKPDIGYVSTFPMLMKNVNRVITGYCWINIKLKLS